MHQNWIQELFPFSTMSRFCLMGLYDFCMILMPISSRRHQRVFRPCELHQWPVHQPARQLPVQLPPRLWAQPHRSGLCRYVLLELIMSLNWDLQNKASLCVVWQTRALETASWTLWTVAMEEFPAALRSVWAWLGPPVAARWAELGATPVNSAHLLTRVWNLNLVKYFKYNLWSQECLFGYFGFRYLHFYPNYISLQLVKVL